MTTRPDKDARDTTRLRQVLLQVKGNPPAHMEAR